MLSWSGGVLSGLKVFLRGLESVLWELGNILCWLEDALCEGWGIGESVERGLGVSFWVAGCAASLSLIGCESWRICCEWWRLNCEG